MYIKPVEGEKKAFVLDNVQDMLAPAQNKLLKVLEEPPENVYFLLGATGEYSVLTTVRSRTKRLELLSFSEEETEAWLKEKFPARTDAHEIAALSGGILGKAEELAEGDSLTQEAQEARKAFVHALARGHSPQPCAPARTGRRRQGCFRSCGSPCTTRSRISSASASACPPRRRIRCAGWQTDSAPPRLVSAQEQITRAEKNLKFNANLPMCLEELFAGILEGR